MRLRDMKELAAEVEKAGWQIALCEHEPMKLITMCLGVKSDRPYLRMDVPNYMRHPREAARSGPCSHYGREPVGNMRVLR